MAHAGEVSVFIDPVSHHFLRNELFNPDNRHNIDGAHEPYFHLRDGFAAQGIEVHTADYLLSGEKRNGVNVYFSLGMLDKFRRLAGWRDVVLSGLFTFEAPIVQPSVYRALPEASRYFKRIYCYSTSEALTRFGCADLRFHKLHIPYPRDRVIDELWGNENRKFLNLLNWNRLSRRRWNELYTERLRALEYFSRFDEIDLYGIGWDKPPYRVGETWIPNTATRIHRWLREHVPGLPMHPYEPVVRKTWRGAAPSKYATQSQYTFTICYENMALAGWLNENLFDCFVVGSIPVYLGPPDITDYVPAECFIDKRAFPTYPELRAYLKSLGPAEIRRYRENARDYFGSKRFAPFTKAHFTELFLQAVREDLGLDLPTMAGVAS
jgi:hypothetical protein